ncbi:uroporphyrinogen-III synthase [Allosediminivita pacifica]|uniref:Uroporphyrinogen-III synthase n=1 Tax=Allosediminivita pacifica TaxID=1267769 RepID=A0A2T6AR93_9RHOB|nr:uroporphyrinogen-III synthase [Allosediminivita pacifica]PTX46266.1 uroporphyrinogen-III synthase [Allosediminivita pacifica]GGB17715.1 uroporphyrinogen III methyltransferase [Allosediminivita pacifica]
MPAMRPVLLMTRPEAASRAFVEALQAAGAADFDPVISPLIEIVPEGPLPDLSDVSAVILTSASAVGAFTALGGRARGPAYCVGPSTARAAKAAGFDVRATCRDAENLVARVSGTHHGGPILHMRGEHARGAVVERLAHAGLETAEAVIYRQPERPLSPQGCAALAGDRVVVAPVFSPRTGDILARNGAGAPLLVAALSEAVAKSLAPLHSRAVAVAARPDQPAMLTCTLDLLVRAGHLETGQDGL